jgi:hypothetical protein
MSPFGPPGFGAQWPEESVELARERGEQQLADAEYRHAKHEARRRGIAGAAARAWRRVLGRSSQKDSTPPKD